MTIAIPPFESSLPVRMMVELDTLDPATMRSYPARFLLPMRDDQIILASGYCNTNFPLSEDGRYFGRLVAVDAAGAQVAWPETLAFRVPASPPAPTHDVLIERPEHPALVTDVPVVYPSIARKGGVEGTVEAELLVCGDGSVEAVSITRSVPLLDASVTIAALQWRFESAPAARRVPVALRFLEKRLLSPRPDWSW